MAKKYFTRNKRSFGNLNILKALSTMALAYTISVSPVFAQQITVDGKTNTSLNVNGNITHVYTETMKGKNAFNSFNKFNVNKGNVVNLVVPDGATNLLNLVSSEQSNIEGVLNSIKSGHIGGNIFIINPYGMAVSSSGVINVGSLTAVTPTNDFVNNFFDAPGVVNETSLEAVLNGTAPINSNAVIDIQGRINAIENVKLDGGSIINSGEIYSGAVFEENNIDVGDVVNVNTLESASNLAVNNGEIVLVATNDITNTGKIVADGGDNVDGGSVSAVAGNDVYLQPDSLISAKGKGENSSGGDIYIWGDNDSYFEQGAVLDARGGDISGDGGFIELSAKDTVNLNGGIFKAKANNGENGSILIDPADLVINNGTDHYLDDQNDDYRLSDGVDISFLATNSITVQDNTIISSRDVNDPANDDHATAVSQGDSGDISFTAPTISFGSGSKLYAQADSGFLGGNITITATGTGSNGVSLGGELLTNANVSITSDGNITQSNTNAIIKGNDINLTSNTGTIGTSAQAINIDTNYLSTGGMLKAYADHSGGTINISEEEGDLTIHTVKSQGDVFLKADGSILAGKIPAYVQGHNITLTSENGAIGDDELRLYTWVNYNSTGGTFSAYADNPNGNIYIRQYPQDMYINEIITQGEFNIYTEGSLYDGNPSEDANITAYSIFLNNASGGYGSATDDLNINTTGGDLEAYADHEGGFIYISETEGDLLVTRAKTYGDVELKADDSILAAVQPGYVIGNNITLTSENGTIGDSSRRLYTWIDYNSTGGVFSAYANSANGAIYIRQYPQDMYINEVITQGEFNIYTEGSLYDGNPSEDANITAYSIFLNNASGGYGSATDDLNINTTGGDLEAYADHEGGFIYISETEGDLLVNRAKTYGDVELKADGSILAAIQPGYVIGNNITLTSENGTIGDSSRRLYTWIDYNSTGGVFSAYADSDIYIRQYPNDMAINEVITQGDFNLYAEGSVLDGNSTDAANISADNIIITSALGSIGTSSSDTLNLNSISSVRAVAANGNIYLREVGDDSNLDSTDSLIVDYIYAKDEIYLRADWQLQNFAGSTIRTTSENSKITLVTDDTKLYDESTSSGGSIVTGANGTVEIGRASFGDIYLDYPGSDNSTHPNPGETTYLTTNERSRINAGTVLEISLSNGNVFINDNYDFISNPVNVGSNPVYIARATDGDMHIGYFDIANINDSGYIHQTEIDNITASEILFGNVLDLNYYSYGDTENIYVYDPDFSATSSTGGASDVTLAASNSIINGTPGESATGIKAHNLTLRGAFTYNDSNIDSENNYDTSLDTAKLRNIGEITGDRFNIDLQGDGKLYAKSYGEVAIYESSGNIYIDRVESLGSSAYLKTLSDICDASNDDSAPETDVLAADNVAFYAGVWNNQQDIGTIDNFIEIDTDTNNDNIGHYSSVGNNFYIEEMSGNLSIYQIRGISSYTPVNVYLKANDPNGADILDYDVTNDNEYNISASNITLEALYGSVGQGGYQDLRSIDILGVVTLTAIAGTLDTTEAETINISNDDTYNGIKIGSYNNGPGIQTNSHSLSTITINGRNSITDSVNDSKVDIKGHQINLISQGIWIAGDQRYGSIGSNPITIQLTGTDDSSKYFDATAYNLINIKSEGDLRVNRIYIKAEHANGNVTLNAFNDDNDASILNVREDSDNNIVFWGGITPTYNFTAEGSIGTSSDPFKIEAKQDFLTTNSGEGTYLYVDQPASTFFAIAASVSGGDYVLTSNSSIKLYRAPTQNTPIVTTNGGNVTLNSDGDIYLSYIDHLPNSLQIDSDGYIELDAGGYVGYVTNPSTLDTSLHVIADDYVTINAGNSVYLRNITAGGNVTINSDGNIIDANGWYPSYSNITGTDISLTALGTVGESIDNLEIEASGTLTIDSVGAIYIDSTSNLNIDTISSDGAINISTVASIVDANDDSTINITGTDVTLTAGVDIGESTDNLEIDYDEISGSITTSAGGSVYVDAN